VERGTCLFVNLLKTLSTERSQAEENRITRMTRGGKLAWSRLLSGGPGWGEGGLTDERKCFIFSGDSSGNGISDRRGGWDESCTGLQTGQTRRHVVIGNW